MPENLKWPDENPLKFGKDEFDSFISWCYEVGASDIIIEAGEVLGAKINGEVYDVGIHILDYARVAEILRLVYQPSAPALLKSGNELNFQYAVLRDDNTLVRFRVNVTAAQGARGSDDGVEIVMRTIPSDIPTYDMLGIPDDIMEACNAKYGIILVTGPTGSGKSTSIAAMLRMLAETRRAHIITYESPIEFDLKTIPNRKSRVIQSEVPENLKDYSVAVANSLRRAPDIILFGEARDRETIAACIRESQTGHLVFSTVHTNNVPMTISRMVDEFEGHERKGTTSKLVDALRMIVHQRLYPKMGGGRVALREYLIFDDAMRRDLHKALMSADDLGTDIQSMLEIKGMPLIADAREKFEEGLLAAEQYASIVNEVGKREDLEIIPAVAKSLFERELIDKETYENWKLYGES